MFEESISHWGPLAIRERAMADTELELWKKQCRKLHDTINEIEKIILDDAQSETDKLIKISKILL